MAEAAVGAVDAKAGEVVGAQRGLHVVITRAFCTKATKPTRIHFATLAREFSLLLQINGVALDVQENASIRFLAALICVKLAHWHSSDVVLVQVGASFPACFANTLEEVFADFAFAIAL